MNPNDYLNAFCQQNAFGQGMGQNAQMQNAPFTQAQVAQVAQKKEKKSMFKEITSDIKGFVLEHRGVIYFLVFAIIVDQAFFKGAFKARLQSMADKLVTKVEEKIQ